ncbi:hypothetical protein DICSQDRAFT_151469 [Dichomitus squalens LYAD-421 SS1]|uniref:uncharacterized protein n=1 Tax=Dichomitus squalens (strain LYAD-421) TaxID=732165 RepID=UPI0004412F8A|nr:uncharacterized protein DICSQDRAFT_151469 [Dichomitus squalens LYAD-421 SS1]EJF67118.1 hypothetical protein DICSQDRAFT_151469 [Dichomitus squalens LYAD-421 SS1]
MDRGRSRDVSPIAFARKAQQQALALRSQSYHSSPPRTTYLNSRDSARPAVQPVASSSRLPPPPSPLHHTSSLSSSPSDTIPRTGSSSSVLSDASEATPLGPLTPPDEFQDYGLDRPLDYYDSPPSPPRSLQDQMHVAYALDNMHLAKILLLKLRGIDVSGDDDPRIAAVRDEDFSSSFVPEGGLRLDADAEARVQEAERRAREARQRRLREERLRRCEQVWERSMQRFRGEKARIARKKEEAQRERREAERLAKERERERQRKAEASRAARGSQLRIASAQPRQLVCYDSLRNADSRFPKATRVERRADDSGKFLYDIMPSPPSRPMSLSPPTSRSPTDKDSLTLPRAQRELALKHAKSVSRSVAFSDVLTAMHGPLFGEEEDNRMYVRRDKQQAELLAILLEPVKLAEKGKTGQDTIPEPVMQAKKSVTARALRASTADSISSTSSAGSSSISTVTRSGSWFSFGSKSSFRSTSTTLTTPSSSPLTSSKLTILSSPLSTSPPSDSPIHTRRRSSKPPPSAPTVPASEHPLALPPPPRPKRKEPLAVGRGRPLTRRVSLSGQVDEQSPPPSPTTMLVHHVSRSVYTIIDLAAQFQRAYVRATMFSAGVDLYGERSRSTSGSRSRSPVGRVRYASSSRRLESGLKPEGYRASSLDVQLFADLDMYRDDSAPQYQRTLIPLFAPSSDSAPAHERVFPIPPPLPRSPFRPPYQPNARISRMRPVANPILLRLQALHNICQAHAIAWQRARDGTLAAGKEKMVGIAWEGIGRSSLSWEVGTGTVY